MNKIIFRRALYLTNHTKIYIQRFENCFDPIIKADKGILEEKGHQKSKIRETQNI